MKFNFNEIFENMMKENNLDTVMVLGHMNPDGDAAGSVMGLSHYLHNVYPEYTVVPYLAKTLDKGPKKLVKTDSVFDPFQYPKMEGEYAVIICDTALIERIIGKEFWENAKISLLIDHHAANEKYGTINCVQISEACAWNVYESLDWSRWTKEEVHPTAADYIYMGILHDTSGFTRANPELFQAVSHLMTLGVDHSDIMKTMKAATYEDEKRRAGLYQFVKREDEGRIAYAIIDQETIEKYKITYEDIHPFSSILRDCEDIELGFTMYEETKGCWRCSFRSDGKWIDVNKLLNHFKGGGHAGAAGCRKHTDDIEELKNRIISKVYEMREGV